MKKNNIFLLTGLILLLLVVQSCKEQGENCALTCQNSGIVTIDCTCACPTGFEGTQCETATCTLVCQNNGGVNQDCECDCPSGFVGANCEICVPRLRFAETTGVFWSPGGTNFLDDVAASLPANYVMTGLGFSTTSTLMIAGREVFSDGTFGDEFQFRAGNDPNGSLQVSYIVPDGHVVTGIGFGLNGSAQASRLVVNYSEVIFKQDCDLELGPPQLYDNNSSDSIDAWLKISDTGLDTRFYAFNNLEIRYDTPTRQVEAAVGKFDNL